MEFKVMDGKRPTFEFCAFILKGLSREKFLFLT